MVVVQRGESNRSIAFSNFFSRLISTALSSQLCCTCVHTLLKKTAQMLIDSIVKVKEVRSTNNYVLLIVCT